MPANATDAIDQVKDIIVASMLSDLAKVMDSKFLYVSKALATATASIAATTEILISKGICTEDELDELTKRSMTAIVNSVKKMADDRTSQDSGESEATRKAFNDLISGLNQTSSEPE